MRFYHFDRTKPLIHFTAPAGFLEGQSQTEFFAECKSDEYFIFPIALLSELLQEEVSVRTSLITEDGTVDNRAVCFQTEGVDKWGKPFQKKLLLTSKQVQPLYIGVDTAGLTGKANLLVTVQGAKIYAVNVRLNILNEKAVRHGEHDLQNLSRLFWLNSTTAGEDLAPKNCCPVAVDGRQIQFLGRTVAIGENGLIASAESYFEQNLTLAKAVEANYFTAPIEFGFEGEKFVYSALTVKKEGDNATIACHWDSNSLAVDLCADVRYEGAFCYRLSVTAKQDYNGQLALTLPISPEASVYNNGLGKYGGYFKDIDFKFNAAHQDTLFVGGVNAGMQLKLKAEQYRRPLINVYYKAQPLVVPATTWDNCGAGSVHAKRTDDGAMVVAQTGQYQLKAGETRHFCFELRLTPFQPLDKQKQFGVRYYHNNRFGNIEKEVKTAKKHGLNYMIVHHGNEVHPFINYPFIETEAMDKLVSLAHKEGIKVKFYYTVRESSNHMAELFAYKAMGDEIILRQKFAGYGWMAAGSPKLKEIFGDDIVSAWRVPFRRGKYKGDEDAAFIVRPDSRLDNYYIEGLKYLVDERKIDGIYIDDTALDRTTLARAKRVLDQVDGLIDMHMWNHEEERAGDASCMNLYTELFPFIDSIWVGEGFDVTTLAEDYILTEVSGLLYGKPSQMLQGGGDPFVGMLYAMNNRYGWGVRNAHKLYRVWDEFQIEKAEMRGYWDKKNPFGTTAPCVKVTAYQKEDETLLAVYNFSAKRQQFALTGTQEYTAQRLKAKGLQTGGAIDPNKMTLGGRSGVFVLLKHK